MKRYPSISIGPYQRHDADCICGYTTLPGRNCDSDCLPPGQGDACFFQQAGFARYAGQTTKKGRGDPPAFLYFSPRCVFL